MSETRFLKTTLFGGYDRAGVEKRFEYLLSQVYSLKNELRESKRMLAEFRKGTDAETAAEGILNNERAKLTQVQVQHESMSKRIKVVEEDLQARNQEVEELKATIASLQDELNEKNIRLSALEAENEAAALGAVFIEAQKSAKLLVENAKKEAAELEDNAKKLAENVVTDANNTAKKIVFDAETICAEKTAAAENQTAQMETASENLRATVLADVEKLTGEISALQQVFDAFRENGIEKLAESAKLLADTEESLKAGGVPVFRIPESVQPELPAEPVYEDVSHNYYSEEPEEDDFDKEETIRELERLRQMADAIGKDETPAEAPSDAPAQSAVPDLAALAAQAAALEF